MLPRRNPALCRPNEAMVIWKRVSSCCALSYERNKEQQHGEKDGAKCVTQCFHICTSLVLDMDTVTLGESAVDRSNEVGMHRMGEANAWIYFRSYVD